MIIKRVKFLQLYKCAFGLKWKIKIISLVNLFLLLFISFIILFGTIYGLIVNSMNFGIYQEKIKHFNLEWLSNVWNFYNCISMHLDWNEKLKLFHYLTYFCYYHGPHCTFWHYSWVPLSTNFYLYLQYFQ